jgi:DNA helicase-2/ATP-dependent DNA helicase PcrA
MVTKIDYQAVLNPAQFKAVMTLEGSVLVIAGAGSGKTRTLVYRVARLVETGISPESILLLTFTRKASAEMLDRAARLSSDGCKRVSGGTFHSLAHRVLRRHANSLGYDTNFTILDRADMEEVIQSLVGEMEIDRGSVRFPKRSTLANVLSKAANLQRPVENLVREEYAQFLEYIPQMERLRELYGGYKRANQLMDYDDLLLFFRQILVEHGEIRAQLGSQFRFIMVDEYQDTNAIQADIIRWVAHNHGNIMVVGDDSQSIYSFRGANYRNMFDFKEMFPRTKIIKLEENYRSTQPVLTFANALMAQAHEKYTKCLFTRRTDGDKPRGVDTGTEKNQGVFVCRSIKQLLSQGRSIKDIAVLFRAAYHSFELELELARQGIPFVKYGGFKFMESAHIKDLLAHLRVAVNREDAVSWGRILRLLKHIGQAKSQAIINWVKTESTALWELDNWSGAGRSQDQLKALSGLLKELMNPNIAPEVAVGMAMNYYEPILKERFDDFPRRAKDLEQLRIMAGRYGRLRAFLDDLMLEPPTSSADINPSHGGNCLTLSTVHSAKGLEWPVVYIIWVMEGYFPSARARSSLETIEEERRLMYVAATRAKDQLVLCYPGRESPPVWQMAEIGYRSGVSSFLQGLPDGVIEYGSCETMGMGTDSPWAGREPWSPQNHDQHASLLRPGDRVAHPAFGRGVVTRFRGEEKVEVIFKEAGRKLLHLEYTSLEKL